MNRTHTLEDDGSLPTTWYRRSTFPHETHTGQLVDGLVVTDCGVEFYLPRLVHAKLTEPPDDPHALCERCRVISSTRDRRRTPRPEAGDRD
jgi:hypothetical protein